MKRGAIDHPKTKRLAKAIGAPAYAAMGLVEALVHWSCRYAPSGNVGKYADDEIEEAVGWDGSPGQMVPTMIEAGFLEAHAEYRVVIHDWYDHADDAVHMALARAGERFWCGRVPKMTRLSRDERGRLEAAYNDERTSTRTENAQQTHGIRTENALPSPPLPSPALPSHPLPSKVPPNPQTGFLAFWHAYPPALRTKQNECLAAWGECMTEGHDPAVIVAKAREYGESEQGRGEYAVRAPRFLAARMFLDPPEAWQETKVKPETESAIMRKARAMEAEAAKGAKR